jgi:hypothetical protein
VVHVSAIRASQGVLLLDFSREYSTIISEKTSRGGEMVYTGALRALALTGVGVRVSPAAQFYDYYAFSSCDLLFGTNNLLTEEY